MRMIAGCRSSLAGPFSSKRFTTYKNKIIASLSCAPAAHESHSAPASPRLAIQHKTKVHYSTERYGLMYRVFAMSDIENKPVAQMRIPARENPSSEIVCLVDDDPMVLRSTVVLLASDGFDVCRFDNLEHFIDSIA